MQCDAQLFLPTSDARLVAIDSETGARCSNFADDGSLNLMHNMPFKQDGFYYSTSPPVVASGLVVVSGAVNDNYNIDSPSGVIRAYDAKTGELEWNWDPGNPDSTAPIPEGEITWKRKNGTVYDMTPLPLLIEMGVPGIGGPIITGGGVAFLAASVDDYLRAYDLTTGEQIWEKRLPAGGQATPMTYLNSKGEQMVVLVAGGHGSIGTTFGDYVIAYKLP